MTLGSNGDAPVGLEICTEISMHNYLNVKI